MTPTGRRPKSLRLTLIATGIHYCGHWRGRVSHGITSGQLYAWRQQLTRRVDGELARPAAAFARVDVIAEVPKAAIETSAVTVKKPPGQMAALASPRAKGLIEILLPGGALVRVDAHVDDRALRCVLGVLHER